MFEEQTPEAIKARMKQRLSTRLETREGSFVDDLLGPVAYELYQAYQSLNAIEPMVWVDETSGPYLDLAAEDIGLEPRKDGTKAETELIVTGQAGVVVPAGKLFCTETGLSYAASREAVIPEEGAVALHAAAQEAGSRYNVASGEICRQYDNTPGVEGVTNPDAAAGGTDAETDAALYARLAAARKSPAASGSSADYERWALEVDGVGAAKVLPRWEGPGTVKVLVVGTDYRPVDEATLTRCKEHIEAEHPVLAALTVATAREKTIDIAASAEAEISPQAVARNLAAALSGYFAGISFRESEIVLNRIGAVLMGLEGVGDYSALQLNGQAENVILAEDEVPVLGTIDINGVVQSAF